MKVIPLAASPLYDNLEPGKIGTMHPYGVFACHVRNLELANMTISFERLDLRPAMVCSDVEELEIDNFKAQTAPGVTPARLSNVTGLIIRDSPGIQ